MAATMTQRVIPGRYQAVPRVLCFVVDRDEVLLLRGAPDKRIWPGLYNGVGGHVESGEDILTAAKREVLEETGLAVDDLCLRGVVNIQTPTPNTGIVMFVFTANATGHNARPSPEGALAWVPISAVTKLPTVPDVPMLLEHALCPRPGFDPFFASYRYDSDGRLDITFGA